MVTPVAALFAFAAKDADIRYIFITYFVVPIFLLLDACYLSQERQYRQLYETVRIKQEIEMDETKSLQPFHQNDFKVK